MILPGMPRPMPMKLGGGAPEFVGVGDGVQASTAAVELNLPAGVANGDFLVAFLWATVSRGMSSAPEGWNLLASDAASSGSLFVYTKVADSEGASAAFEWSSSATISRNVMLAYRNVEVAQAGSFGRTAISATLTAPSLSAPADGILLAAFGSNDTDTMNTGPSMTLRAALENFGARFFVYDEIPCPAGATGNRSQVYSGTGGRVAVQVHLS